MEIMQSEGEDQPNGVNDILNRKIEKTNKTSKQAFDS